MACAAIRDNSMMRTHPVCLFPPTFNLHANFTSWIFYSLTFTSLTLSFLPIYHLCKEKEKVESKLENPC